MPTKHDAIYDYIIEPLLNSYVSNNFKTGLELCHYRLASSINKLDKESVSTGMRYLDALMLFKDISHIRFMTFLWSHYIFYLLPPFAQFR